MFRSVLEKFRVIRVVFLCIVIFLKNLFKYDIKCVSWVVKRRDYVLFFID